jgi:hypothetical protein
LRVPLCIQFPEGLDWSRTNTVIFTHATCCDGPGFSPAFSVDTPLLDLVYVLTEYGKKDVGGLADELDTIFDSCISQRWGGAHQDAGPNFGDVQIWLHDEAEVELAQKILVDDADDKWKNKYSSLKIDVKP